MPAPQRTRFSVSALVIFAFLLPALAACQNGDAKEPKREDAAAADSAAAASSGDSTGAAADSSHAQKSWKDRLFNKGGGEEEEKEDPPVPVETARVALRDMPAYLSATATLEPDRAADLLSKAGGEVRRLLVEEGDWAKEGQVLVELDSRTQRVILEEATARMKGLSAELDRTRALHTQQLASDKDLENAEARFAEGEAQRKRYELDVTYTQITAPFAGRVTRRMVNVGQTVTAGTHLFTLVDSDPLLARIYLPEREVSRLSEGQTVQVKSDSEESVPLTGRVMRIAPVVDTRTGTVKVTCEIDGATGVLRPGSFVRVEIETGVHEDVAAIPKRALVPEGAETFVYRVEADSVLKTPITIGLVADEFVEVVGGLDIDQSVVSVGHGALKTGSRIKVLPTPAGSDSTATTQRSS